MSRVHAPRPGYTLLEVICAMAIAVVLLAALYVAMHVQYEHVQAGREVVEQATLAHALVDRMTNDLSRTLGPQNPAVLLTNNQNQSSSSQSSSTATTSTTGTTPSATATSTPTFNIGLQGDESSFTIYVSTGRRDLTAFSSYTTGNNSQTPTDANGQEAVLSDIHRITYQLGNGGGEQSGLMRQDVVVTTGLDDSGQLQDDANEDAAPFIPLAPEVIDLHFQYLDPQQGWVQQWPAQATGYDSTSTAPFGPPMAVEIRMTLQAGEMRRTYRHVVPILTADGTPQQAVNGSQSGSSNSTTSSNGQ